MRASLIARALGLLMFVPLLSSCGGQKDLVGTGPSSIPAVSGPPPGTQAAPKPGAPMQPSGTPAFAPPPGTR